MTRRLTAAIAAGALAVGILIGAAGAVVVGNATADTALDRHYELMGSTMDMMGSSGMGSMMDMMGGSMMSGADEMGPNSEQHEAHHPDSDQ
jgi:predicted phage tail protein